jgi:hypothetical protein
MNLKLSLPIIIISVFLALALNVVQGASSGDATPFSLDEISAGVQITSPISNKTYTESAVLLNVTLYLGATEWVPRSHVIPYQEINCVYSLDNGEWKNAPLTSTIQKEAWQSIVNKCWYNQMESNYTVVLQGLSEGLHFIRVAVKPDNVHSYNYYSFDLEPSVNFTINNPNATMILPSAQPKSETQQAEATYAVAVGTAIIIVIALIAVVLKKRDKSTCFS